MRINDVTQVGVLSMTAVPVFRAQEGTRVFTSALIEHAACPVALAKAGEVFSLKPMAVAGVELRGRVQEPVQVYGQPLQRQAKGGLTGSNGTSGFGGDAAGSTGAAGTTSTTSTTSTNGTNPIDPWDLRTSSPPG